LQTGEKYYFSVKAIDNAGNTSGAVDSNGQEVLPVMSYSIDNYQINFSDLNVDNNWEDQKTNSITTSTNAANGYVVYGYINKLLTGMADPAKTIANFAGSWANPAVWNSGNYGFGYTSSDNLVQDENRFAGSTKFAGFSTSAPGDIIADHTDPVDGTTGAVNNEKFDILYKVAVESIQSSQTYQTQAVFIVSPKF
jgi:hypothetical protein